MFLKIKNWFKKKLDTRELKKSDYARDFGWYIEYNGEFIGELIDPKWDDMFWYTYKITSNHEKWNAILTRRESWNEDTFTFKSKYYNQYALHAFSGDPSKNINIKNDRISMRTLYLTELDR